METHLVAPRRLIHTTLAALLLFPPAAFSAGSTIELDLDQVDTSAGPVQRGTAAFDDYLSGNGIFVSHEAPAGSQMMILSVSYARDGASGSLGTNVLTQANSVRPEGVYRLNFVDPLDALEFSRPELVGLTLSGVSSPQWTASAFDAQGVVLASVGEPYRSGMALASIPAQRFLLDRGSGGPIAYMEVLSSYQGAGTASPLLNDFRLTIAAPVPEPSPSLLTLVGAGCLWLFKSAVKRAAPRLLGQ